jgi:hypothetical protein
MLGAIKHYFSCVHHIIYEFIELVAPITSLFTNFSSYQSTDVTHTIMTRDYIILEHDYETKLVLMFEIQALNQETGRFRGLWNIQGIMHAFWVSNSS